MANTTISPNMNLPIPTVSQDPGPDWANNIDACLFGIDSHNHANGQGVPISPSGMDINADLPFNGNNLTTARSIQFTAQGSPLVDLDSVYVSGVDLYYTDGSGNQVRITQGGSVTGSTGTITGLPSGTASASFAAGTFTFQSATNTPATMAVGPLVIGAQIASPKTVTLGASASQPANYNMTLPLALPGSTSIFDVDSAGNMGYASTTGSGNVVLSDSPTFSGTITFPGTIDGGPSIISPTILSPNINDAQFFGTTTGTIAAASYTPSVGSGGAGTGQAGTANSFTYTRINNEITVYGRVSGTTDNAGALYWTISVPITSIAVANSANGGLSPNGGNGILSNIVLGSGSTITASLQVNATLTSITAGVTFRYTCA